VQTLEEFDMTALHTILRACTWLKHERSSFDNIKEVRNFVKHNHSRFLDNVEAEKQFAIMKCYFDDMHDFHKPYNKHFKEETKQIQLCRNQLKLLIKRFATGTPIIPARDNYDGISVISGALSDYRGTQIESEVKSVGAKYKVNDNLNYQKRETDVNMILKSSKNSTALQVHIN